jgi:hypothetical protein
MAIETKEPAIVAASLMAFSRTAPFKDEQFRQG